MLPVFNLSWRKHLFSQRLVYCLRIVLCNSMFLDDLRAYAAGGVDFQQQ